MILRMALIIVFVFAAITPPACAQGQPANSNYQTVENWARSPKG